MDLDLFMDMLAFSSTSGSERAFAQFLMERLRTSGCEVSAREVGDGTLNVLLDWSGTGRPSFVFCTHMDTVPPYIAPSMEQVRAGGILPDGNRASQDDTIFKGRGTCDAKGQIFSMYCACLELQKQGFRDFGLLILSGEETGSFGAKAWTRDCPGGDFVLVGEPTGNCLVSASKGTKAFEITLKGRPCHSGYPEEGRSAVRMFVDLMNMLDVVEFPEDEILGRTTWNAGRLVSDNPQNILSPSLTFRLYFRTTFATDALIHDKLLGACPRGGLSTVEAFGGDEPLEYFSDVEGISSRTVSFGSDAPRLTRFRRRAICGPGSILTAHTDNEYVLLSDLLRAVEQDILIFKKAKKQFCQNSF